MIPSVRPVTRKTNLKPAKSLCALSLNIFFRPLNAIALLRFGSRRGKVPQNTGMRDKGDLKRAKRFPSLEITESPGTEKIGLKGNRGLERDLQDICGTLGKLVIGEERGNEEKGKDNEIIVIESSDDEAEVVIVEDDIVGNDKENQVEPRRNVRERQRISLGGEWWVVEKGSRAFARRRERMAQELLQYFDRMIFEGRLLNGKNGYKLVEVGWNRRLYKTAGIAILKRREKQKSVRIARIEFSVRVVDEPLRLYETMAHELSHAAAWVFDNVIKPPHGQGFKMWARRFENFDKRIKVTTCHSYEITYKFSYVCQECNFTYGRHSKSIDTSKMVCGKCKGVLKMTTNKGRRK